MKTFFLDTNIFLRFLVDSKGRQHRECISLFEKLESGQVKALTCALVLMEINFTLKSFYHFPEKRCQQIIKRIMESKNLKMIDSYNYQKFLQFLSVGKVKFVDCLIASLSFFEKGGKIISYDNDFDKLGLKRIEPGDLFKKK